MKVYNKFVESKKEPSNKNDIWFDGSSWKIYKEGMWRSFTLPLDAAVEINKILQEDKSVLQQELKNYLKIQDSPFEKGSAENSAVLRGGNNIATGVNSFAEGGYTKALSEVAHAEGLKTISGRISQLIDPTTGNIRELTDEEISTLVNEALRIGLITSQNEFNNDVAMKLIGSASHSEGSKTKALGTSSHAEGNNTEASSNSSHAEGDSTHAWGEASHAEGYLTEANGNQSHSEGKQTKAQGNSSHAEGIETQANGWGSHAEGNKTITNNIAEHASGQYNKSTKSTDKAEATHFSIGIGTSDTKRKNAVEVKQNGDVYIKGIGGYDGTNPTESRDLRSVIEPIIIEWDSIKDYANGEGLNNMAELPWLDKTISGEYKKYNWAIQKDGIIHPCVVIPDLNSNQIQMLFFTRNEIEGTTGPLGNAIMKYSGLRMTTGWDDIYEDEYYKAIYKISNGGSLEVREFVFGENTNKNAYLLAAAQLSGIDTIDCKWVYTTKADETITVNGQYFHIENSITNVDAIFSVKDKSLTYVDGNGLINKVTFADNGSYAIIPDTVVKTTPQTLSDTDKNQALANLGIDPVVWKYMCNPYILRNGATIPDELVGEDNVSFKYKNRGMYLIRVTDIINDHNWDINGEIYMYIPVIEIERNGQMMCGIFTFIDTKGELVSASVNVYCNEGKILINSYTN